MTYRTTSCARALSSALFTTLVAATASLPVQAQTDTPLVIEGKTSLLQRVLIRERVPFRDARDGAPTGIFAPLQALYVYERDGEWMRVGLTARGGDTRWVPIEATADWNQNIVATFESSAGVGRVMFFEDEDTIYEIIESEAPGQAAGPFMAQALAAENGGAPSDAVSALGPEVSVDQRSNLYVMPILDFEEAFFDNGARTTLLEVAVARSDLGGMLDFGSEAPLTPQDRENYRAAVVFVVDTTISMQPFISATRDALAGVYEQIEASGHAGSVSFGLVGYRDNLVTAPDLEYDVRSYVNLSDGADPQAFLEGIDRMTEARVTSRNFREDSYSGIEYALTAMDWSDFGQKYVVLVTDASPRTAEDEFSATGLSASGLNDLVRQRIGGFVGVMHLQTASGARANDHDRAEAEYSILTRQPNNPPLYFPVPNGDPDIYRETAADLGRIIASQVAAFRSGDDAQDAPPSISNDSLLSALQAAGQTMQLAYLGSTRGASAPDVFQAYIADRDFDRPGLSPLSVRVLLSKDQLSDLDQALRLIITQIEESITTPDQFFSQILVAAADMSRDPENVGRASDVTLAEAVSVNEYLSDLPYQSQIMQFTEEEWLRLSIPEQILFQTDLMSRLELYQRYNQTTDLWVDYLGMGPQAENLLFPMPIENLP